MLKIKNTHKNDDVDSYFKPIVDLVVGLKDTGQSEPPFASPSWKTLKNHIIIESEYIPQEVSIDQIIQPHYFRMRMQTVIKDNQYVIDWCDNWGNAIKYINDSEMVTSSPCIAILFRKTNETAAVYELTIEKYRINSKNGQLSSSTIFYEKKLFLEETQIDKIMAYFMEKSEDLEHFKDVIHTTMRLFWHLTGD